MKSLLALVLATSLQAAVTLTWTDNSSNELGFRIERSFDGTSYLPLVSVGVNTLAYTDTTTLPSTTYYYRVLAFNGAGDSSFAFTSITTGASENTSPIISDIPDQIVTQGSSTQLIPFSVNDAESLSTLSIVGSSSNTGLVPNASIVILGSGTNRTVQITPQVPPQSATITIVVSDGELSSYDTFVLVVRPPQTPTTQIFSNTQSITIPDSGKASPYPSSILVGGMGGSITSVAVTLKSITHTYSDDIDVLLVGPDGKKAMVFSDAGGGSKLSNTTYTLSDSASSSLGSGANPSGIYKPTDLSPNEARDTFPAPAPVKPYTSNLSIFNGTNPNGTWSLYVQDDGSGDSGVMAGGWSLTITTN